MSKQHTYRLSNTWTGNKGSGTKSYNSYNRSYQISIKGKPTISGSSDPAFRGDPSVHNPEELFLASIASCHMLWFLHLCAVNRVVVTEYKDDAVGYMEEGKDGSGAFTKVALQPHVTVTEVQMIEKANSLHEEANKMCFIANSCNFPIVHDPDTTVKLL